MSLSETREADFTYAFCTSGQGHQGVNIDPPEPEVGILTPAIWCQDCGTDLSNDHLINPQGANHV